MARKIFMALAVALLLSGNAMAQSESRERSSNFWAQVTQWFQSHRDSIVAQRPRPSRPVQSVPELDGNMALMALGLTIAVGGLIREKRRAS